MWKRVATAILPLLLCSRMALAQATISIQVTHTEDQFDLRAVDPSGAAYALNLNRGTNEIWRSTDNARSWSFRGALPDGTDFKTLTSLDDGTLLGDAQGGGAFALYRSGDQGATWTQVIDLVDRRLLTPHSILQLGNSVYLLEYQEFTDASVPINLWASTDDGQTWSIRQTFQGHRHGHGMTADPSGAIWAFFGDNDSQSGVYRSTDGGFTWSTVLTGGESIIDDGLFVGNTLLAGQDISDTPLYPYVINLTASGVLTKIVQIPGPSYSIHAMPTGGFLLGTTREIYGGVYAPGDVSAHLLGSPDGQQWVELGSYPRIDDTDYARADVYWTLPTGEAVLNLRHVTTLDSGRGYQLLNVVVSGSPIGPVTNLAASGGSGQVALTWTNPTGAAYAATRIIQSATGYASSPAPSGDQTIVFDASGTSTTVTGLAAGTTWFYTAWARDTSGNWSTSAATATATTASPQPIGPVTNLVATGGTGQVGLTWTNPTGAYASTRVIQSATGFASSPAPSGDQTIVFDASGTGATVTGLAAGTTYFYTAWARDTSGHFSATSATASATTAGGGGGGPVSFSDPFSECTSTTDLGPNWTLVNGRWYCASGKARGELATSLALANTEPTTDTDITVRVQLSDATLSAAGLALRVSGGTYYAAVAAAAGHLQLVRVNGGSATVLGDVALTISAEPVSHRLRLRATGGGPVQLDVWLDGVDLISTQDASAQLVTAGQAGLYNGNNARCQFDSFSLSGTTSTTPPPIGPVTGLVATGGTGQVALSWTNPTNATYAATRVIQSATGFASSPTPSGDQTIVFDAAGTGTTVTGLPAGTTWFYTAWARDTSGNYSATAATASATTSGTGTPVNFSDAFTSCTSTTDLGPGWTIVNGRWYCAGSKGRGESASSQALANTASMIGTDVTARVQLSDPSLGSGGVVARSRGGSYYAARLLTSGDFQIIRVDGATVTVLGDYPTTVSPEPASYRIRLRVSGTGPIQLVGWFAGVHVLSVMDNSAQPLVSGQSGLYNGTNTRGQYNGFNVTSF